MGVWFRAPSTVSSVDSDSDDSISEIPKDDHLPFDAQIPRGFRDGKTLSVPPRAGGEMWVLYVGNLHPRVEGKDLFGLFQSFLGQNCGGIKNIIIRATRGCCVVDIPSAERTEADRLYATVHFEKFAPAMKALETYREKPPILYGHRVIVTNNAADLPDCEAIMKRVLGPKTETKPTKRRLTAQKTQVVVEDDIHKQRSPGGPSKKLTRKPRYNPMSR